jgi:carboxypeptidase family protein
MRARLIHVKEPQGLSKVVASGMVIVMVLGVGPAANIRAGQPPNGTLRGTITIASPLGQPLAIVGVSLKLTGAGAKPLSTFSYEQGNYKFVGLRPGSYNLEAAFQGFKTVRRSVMVGPAAAVVENIRLELADQHAEVGAHESRRNQFRRAGYRGSPGCRFLATSRGCTFVENYASTKSSIKDSEARG